MANPEQEQTTQQSEAKSTQSEVLTNLYWKRRIEYQLEYYQERARDYEQHVDVAFRLGAILMTFSSLLASLGVVLSNNPTVAPLISLMTAIIPAIVSYIAAFRQLYQWDRQLALYRDTQLNLESAKLSMPDLEMLNSTIAEEKFPELVSKVEGVLKEEISQWGRIARGEEEDDEAEQDLTETFRIMLANRDGNVNQDQLDELLRVFNANQGTPDAGQYRLAPDELETESALLDDNSYDQSEIRAQEARERRERQAQLARAAAQEASQIPQSPQASAPILPSAQATSAATVVAEAPATDPIIETSPVIDPNPAPVDIPATDPEPPADLSISAPVTSASPQQTDSTNADVTVAEDIETESDLDMPELEVFEEQFGDAEVEDDLNIVDPLDTVKFDSQYAVDDIEGDSDYIDTYDVDTDD